MAETYSAGIVTAYGAAVRGGYTGTYEEFCAEQASFAENAKQVGEDREAMETLAAQFSGTTVPAAVQTVQNAGAAQIQAVESASETEQQQIALAGAAQETRVTQAGDDQVDAIEEAGTTQVGNVSTAGTTQVGAVNTAGATQVQAVEDKGQEVIDSIPADYTDLTEDVADLKSAITNSAADIIDVVWIANIGITADSGASYPSTMVKVSDYIPVGEFTESLLIKLPTYQSDTTFGYCFYNKNKAYLTGTPLANTGYYGSETKSILIPEGAYYVRVLWFNDESTYGEWTGQRIIGQRSKRFYSVAAYDSSEADKNSADYVCQGFHDENLIAQVLRSATYNHINEIKFAVGTYVIDSFPYEDSSGIKVALPVGRTAGGNRQTLIKISGAGYGTFRANDSANGLYSGAKFVVSSNCYSSLSDSDQYAIFACSTYSGNRNYPGTKFDIEHFGFILPDNQKKIICIDGWNMSALSFEDIHLMAVAPTGDPGTGAITPELLKVPVDGCIGVRGLQGSCYGINNIWKSSFAWGFETGFQVVGEHIVGIELGTRFCKHGFTFGSLSRSFTGSLAHPNTLINCCDELNFNLPLFGYTSHSENSKTRQSITIIDYNLEWQPEYAALGGELATELAAGETYGELTFSNVGSHGTGINDVDVQFWKSGHGNNVKTKNSAHSIAGTTAERNSYTPTYMQMYYDTTLEKLLIYNGSSWAEI